MATPSPTSVRSTAAVAKVVLDATVIVAHLNAGDTHARRARELVDRLRKNGDELLLLDFLVGEAVSVLARRASEGRLDSVQFATVMAVVRQWHRAKQVLYFDMQDYAEDALDTVVKTNGRIGFNDSLLVVLQKDSLIGPVASFDTGFDAVPLFEVIS